MFWKYDSLRLGYLGKSESWFSEIKVSVFNLCKFVKVFVCYVSRIIYFIFYNDKSTADCVIRNQMVCRRDFVLFSEICVLKHNFIYDLIYYVNIGLILVYG